MVLFDLSLPSPQSGIGSNNITSAIASSIIAKANSAGGHITGTGIAAGSGIHIGPAVVPVVATNEVLLVNGEVGLLVNSLGQPSSSTPSPRSRPARG